MIAIQWMTLDLEIPGGSQLIETAREFWSAVAPQAGDYLTTTRGDDGTLPHRTARPDGGCAAGFQLSPGSSLDAARQEAQALGAAPGAPGPAGVVHLISPGGYGFTLTIAETEVAPPIPPAVALGHEGPNRPDQLCLDIPPDRFLAECAFWEVFTGWPLRDGSRPEFAYLERAPGIPLRVLLQRRDQAGPGDRVTGHLDFASADRSALAAEHQALGATLVGEWEHWIALLDPAGRIYCLTARPPSS